MTDEEIDAMEAGHETDATVERFLFGNTTHRCVDGSYRSNSGLAGRKRNVPNYSTDIADAWLVVEKLKPVLKEHRLHWLLDVYAEENYGAKIVGIMYATHFYAEAETAPLAICRAALKAMERITTNLPLSIPD